MLNELFALVQLIPRSDLSDNVKPEFIIICFPLKIYPCRMNMGKMY